MGTEKRPTLRSSPRKRGLSAAADAGRLMVRDAPLRVAPHHEAEEKPHKEKTLILRSPPEAGVSKDEAPTSTQSLYRLMAWLSPAYPVGAFSYSHGVETAVEEGFIKDRVSLVAPAAGSDRCGQPGEVFGVRPAGGGRGPAARLL